MTSYADTYYAASLAPPTSRPSLDGRGRAEIAVVGCGYTGLSAALHLAEMGKHVVALEAERVGFAASGRNGGQVHSGFNVEQRKLEAQYGRDRAVRLWRLAEQAKALVRDRVQGHAIACDLRDGIMLAAHDEEAARDLHERARHLGTSYGYEDIRYLTREEINGRIGTKVYRGGIYDRGGARLQPLAFALGLAKAAEAAGARILESSRVLRVVETLLDRCSRWTGPC